MAATRSRKSRRSRQKPALVSDQPVAACEPEALPLIVGIGGSAGSLSPLRELLAAIPADCGMALVVVSHQAPTGHSMLPEILAKCTAMPVREIAGTTRVEAGHVYVEPRGHTVAIEAGVLSLDPDTTRRVPHLPIDRFFLALARDQGKRAAGIVLSGTGTDGTLGLAAIRAASGLSLVQDPATAEFAGMPVSAIEANAADFVLSPVEMPERLSVLRKGLGSLPDRQEVSEVANEQIQAILAIIRRHGGHDFSEYKHATLARRIARRMHLHGIADPQEYTRFLEQSEVEIDALWHDWLIGVSSFFREPEAFQALEAALPELLAGRGDGSTLRVWIPACATGEEVYSIVIVLVEALRDLETRLQLQVFATDLDSAAIRTARAGRYPEGIAASISENRLARFFTREDGFYTVRKELRDLVVFAVQDALYDPPFTRVDLLSCRNLLIYLQPRTQRRLLATFHYSLNPRGLLLLGSSEHATGSEEYFTALEGRCKLYRRNDSTAPQPTLRWPSVSRGSRDGPAASQAVGVKTDLALPLQRALAERFAPTAVLVDAKGQIQQIHGQVGPYLGLQAGRINMNVLDLAQEGIRAPLASALRESSEADGRIAERSVHLAVEGRMSTVHLEVSRVRDPGLRAPLFLVSFEPEEGAAKKKKKRKRALGTVESKAHGGKDLERQLWDTRHDLQSTIDELQAANEELAASNEEAQSANEELQGTNEELQTAKEEAQSLNEELHAVNAELTQKLESFERATDDLLNFMNNIEVATIFLDRELRVRRFTPQARRASSLIDTDIGRPLSDLAIHLDYPDLLSDATSVIDSLQTSETQALAPDGSWYLVRIRPYRTARNVVDGVVITFFDITDAKRGERLQAARALAESIVDAVREPFLVLDGALRVVRANRAYYEAFGVEPEQSEGRLIGDLGSHQWSIPGLRERLERALRDGTSFDDFEVETDLPHLGRRKLLLSARPFSPMHDTVAELVLLGIQGLSELQADVPGTEAGRP